MRIYTYDLADYIFIKDISGSSFNGLLSLDATSLLKKENMGADDWVNYFSIFIIFGYPNRTNVDITKDISFLLKESDNYNSNINIVSFLYEDLTIENNIFGYIPDHSIKLLSIPNEILIFKEDATTPIEKNSILYENEKYILRQNMDLTKTSKFYYLEYQQIIREPDFDDLYANAAETITYPSDTNYNFQEEYEPQRFYGKKVRLNFKLCHSFCETCNEIGVSNDNQKCLTCLPNYKYDY